MPKAGPTGESSLFSVVLTGSMSRAMTTSPMPMRKQGHLWFNAVSYAIDPSVSDAKRSLYDDAQPAFLEQTRQEFGLPVLVEPFEDALRRIKAAAPIV